MSIAYTIVKNGKEYKITKSYYYPTKKEIKASKIGKRKAEKIFNVNLINRRYFISFDLSSATISFWDKKNVFGWLERINKKLFWKRYSKIT